MIRQLSQAMLIGSRNHFINSSEWDAPKVDFLIDRALNSDRLTFCWKRARRDLALGAVIGGHPAV
jgi:hypothetical protein